MGAFSDLSINIRERAELGRTEWAVLLSDEKRPAKVWRIMGEARGFYMLIDKRGREIFKPAGEVWPIA